MRIADRLRNSNLLRRPLLAASKALFSLLRDGPPILRRLYTTQCLCPT